MSLEPTHSLSFLIPIVPPLQLLLVLLNRDGRNSDRNMDPESALHVKGDLCFHFWISHRFCKILILVVIFVGK